MNRPRPIRLAPLFAVVTRPIQLFFRLQAASGVMLLAAAGVALAWANSSFAGTYRDVLAQQIVLGGATRAVRFTVLELVNDGLMTLFFLVVGMEIKRELVCGELRTLGRALLPLIAAIGGMIFPALLFLAFNAGGAGQRGWGVPMATDIAFCVGCLTLLRKRVPHGLIVFVTALAIFDDIVGILVIAFFYGGGVSLSWITAVAGVVACLVMMNRLYVRSALAWTAALALLWRTLHHAGVHATLSAVIVGLLVPGRALRPAREVLAELSTHTQSLLARPADQQLDDAELLAVEERLEDLETPLARYIHALHPWVAFGVMPVFALANSGVSLTASAGEDIVRPIPLGIIAGLFLGKQLGIFLFTIAALGLGIAGRPGGASLAKIYGVSVLAGIGFTVALFIAQLAFGGDPGVLDQAKLGILVASLASGVAGSMILRMTKPLEG